MYIPKAPTPSEQRLFTYSDRGRIYLLSGLSLLTLFSGMTLFILEQDFIPYEIFAFVTIFYLTLSYLLGAAGRDFSVEEHERLWTKYLDRSSHQDLDIYLPICGEPREIIENTWKHVRLLRLKHEGLLRIYVLDDGKSDEMKTLASQYGFYYIRREGNELKKAGNLRNAFAQTSGEFIVIFDADFCPAPNFLIETLPYMYQNPRLGILQTPQFFEVREDMTDVQKGSASIQELFYRLIQVNRDTYGAAICVGSNAVYRRSHLAPFGGTAAIGYSEDVRTGFQLLRSGSKVKYIPICLAKGTCPETWKQFFTQNYRWAMGSISLFLSREFWTAKISLTQRLCFLTGMFYYITTGLSVLFLFAPTLYILAYHPEYLHWYNLLFSVPSLLFTTLYLRYWQKTPFTWSALEARWVSYYAHLFALLDTLRDTKEAWIPTGARVRSKNYNLFRRLFLIHNVTILLAVCALSGLRVKEGLPPENLILLALFLYYHVSIIIRPLVTMNMEEKEN